jgi:hypothetical protein
MVANLTSWTCDRCGVTVRWMPGCGSGELPEAWIEQDDVVLCLACRRALAGEAGVEAAGASLSPEGRVRLRKEATVEFEIDRDADRTDQIIARACGTSPATVTRARERLRARRALPRE